MLVLRVAKSAEAKEVRKAEETAGRRRWHPVLPRLPARSAYRDGRQARRQVHQRPPLGKMPIAVVSRLRLASDVLLHGASYSLPPSPPPSHLLSDFNVYPTEQRRMMPLRTASSFSSSCCRHHHPPSLRENSSSKRTRSKETGPRQLNIAKGNSKQH